MTVSIFHMAKRQSLQVFYSIMRGVEFHVVSILISGDWEFHSCRNWEKFSVNECLEVDIGDRSWLLSDFPGFYLTILCLKLSIYLLNKKKMQNKKFEKCYTNYLVWALWKPTSQPPQYHGIIICFLKLWRFLHESNLKIILVSVFMK